MQLHEQNDQEALDESHRYEVLLEMADLMVRHRSLPELFQEIATRLHRVANFQFLNFSLYDAQDDSMRLYWWEGHQTSKLPDRLSVDESAAGWVHETQQELFFLT
jgi:hypothetical protein